MLRQFLRSISFKPGTHNLKAIGGTTAGSIVRKLLGASSSELKWGATGKVFASEIVGGKQTLKFSLTADETDLRVTAKGPVEVSAEVEDVKGQPTLTNVHVTKALASLFNQEVDVSGIKVSGLNIPLNVESTKENTSVSGKVSPKEIVGVPEYLRKIIGMFANPVEVTAELTKTEEVENSKKHSV